MSIAAEQQAFDSARDCLLASQAGKFALFMNCELQGIFGSYDEAYRAGLDRFGVDIAFLVAKVEPLKNPEPVSLALDAGLIGGEAQ